MMKPSNIVVDGDTARVELLRRDGPSLWTVVDARDVYLDEFTFRLNEGNVKRHSLERLDSMIEAVSGKRLTYAGLTA